MRWLTGLLLVFAAVLKAFQLVTDPAAIAAAPSGIWLLPSQVGIELGVGLILLSGLFQSRARLVALLLFAGFAVNSFRLAASGATSCGCFGPVHIHPWWTFLLDSAVVSGLIVSLRRGSLDFHAIMGIGARRASKPIIAMTLGLAALAGAGLVRYAGSRVAPAADLLSSAQGTVILQPEKWIGQRLPIADFIDLDLSQGTWIVLLHRHDCPDCQAAVPRYQELAARESGARVALVEVPPFSELSTKVDIVYRGRLKDSREWFVRTPVEIRLVDGAVTSASTELPSLLSLSAH